jgi:ABC-type Fe3+-hydroxamate transport system substrate-binding protein
VHVGGTKDPDIAAIAALAADLVVVNDEENRKEDFDALERAGLAVHVVQVATVDDVAPAMQALASAVGTSVAAPALPARRPSRLRAFVPIWRRPWMTMNAETYGSSVLAHLGVTNVFADAPTRYPTVVLEDLAGVGVDVVLAPSEPYPFSARHEAELGAIAPVTFVDGQDLFWWGVRTPDALERLGAQLASLGEVPG